MTDDVITNLKLVQAIWLSSVTKEVDGREGSKEDGIFVLQHPAKSFSFCYDFLLFLTEKKEK